MLITQEMSMQIDDLLQTAQSDLIKLSKEMDKEIANGRKRVQDAEKKTGIPDLNLLMKRLIESLR